ncbi:MAG: hypothetical protein M3235_17610, partial [Actinomycetota bacterium]|nr:hypothetical protein [Actinomycetota bacterium]
DRDTARERASGGGRGASDAGPELADRLAAEADPWPEAVGLDTGDAPEATLERAVAAVGVTGRASG